ncbi:hypothetical protein RFI_01081 [Reticulomyxa filosa]|uniref:Uncharacterized protein n=1 Tax=Reticulomyxa filosa TaxID=46433 RepID=X6PCQ3_RETFI|nr:hypothetical protein RFI_01081 [Reticulomyxa filosa]|eukprot:ETO35981.1 hypothetical protein RFI_01081 [Reticulomyxa filosa]
MDQSDMKVDETFNFVGTPFETLASLPIPFLDAQCITYKDEILIYGGYQQRNCYSYHIIKHENKLICSYPDDIDLEGHCVVKMVNNDKNDNKDSNEITLLSFGDRTKIVLCSSDTIIIICNIESGDKIQVLKRYKIC